MKVRALKNFEGIKDLERDVFPKEGDIWECSEERAELLLNHGVVEIVREENVVVKEEIITGPITEIKKPKKKKTSKK